MGQSAQTNNYTTLDELMFIQSIHKAGNVKLLRLYIRQCQVRSWTGTGMNVDPHEVILHAMEKLDDLEGRQWTSRMHRPWGVQ